MNNLNGLPIDEVESILISENQSDSDVGEPKVEEDAGEERVVPDGPDDNCKD